ncbi:hypothetical protein [Bradyrhizobium erythrophlei]|jgi:hypothetical protein|uniref:Uncharacterized protein n=1 Tax=Bradyrhizobium erythrophlei TaxID=1437360 RepID=A0A1M7UMC3_9BRAD|nr:hypothetical protein [Bradyrhizobium erythrophlei]SHN84056.1 hypothetical protein SAMN05444170_5765 [Bradyrhizobium erythrophlei]
MMLERVSSDPTQSRLHAETIATLIAAPVTKAKFSDREEIIEICREEWEEQQQFSFSQERLEQKIEDAWSGGRVLSALSAGRKSRR